MLNPFEVLQACSEEKSKKVKLALLEENKCKTLDDILRLALNPFASYLPKKYKVNFAEPMEHTEGFDFNWHYATHLVKNLESGICKGDDIDKAIHIASANLNSEQQAILMCILKKKLEGVTAKMINEKGKKVPTFAVQEPIECSNPEEIEYPAMAEPCYKGIRTIILVENGKVFYHDTSGKNLEHLDKFDEELLTMCCGRNTMFDAIVKGLGEKDLKKKSKKLKKAKCFLIDIMPIGAFKRSACGLAQGARIANLREVYFDSPERDTCEVKILKGKLCNKAKDVEKYLKKMKGKGVENIIVKDLKAPYTFGESQTWFKL